MAMLACIAPPTTRTAISTHMAVAMAVPKKLMHRPRNPSSKIGRLPYWSESAPKIGDETKFAAPKLKATAPNQ